MAEAERYSFTETDKSLGAASYLPFLPLVLIHRDHSLQVSGLLDTGSAVNVLPFDIGSRLGAVWDEQTVPVYLTGTLARLEARGLILSARVGQFTPVRLAFAWTQSNDVPLILGQINFFLEFDVFFSRSQLFFEVRPKGT